jgi:hypothetical protein
MSLALIRLFLGGALKRVVDWLSHRSFWQIVCMGLCALILVQHFELKRSRAEAANWHSQYNAEHSGRLADRKSYQDAQAAAHAKNLADVAADKAARERITHDISQSYEAQLASLRADLARRLHGGNPAAQGSAGGSGLPGVSPAPSGADGGSRVSIPSSLYVRGAELELWVEQWQRWAREQAKVNPNKN